jgi:ubiquinol-cytochrome c reductase iron-sulfur subunit
MPEINRQRRFLLAATAAAGITGVGFGAIPFIESMLPSARAWAQGGPVTADISKIEPGQQITIEWRKKPVFIVRRTPSMLARLPDNAPLLVDPQSKVASQQPPYARNLYRSIRPEILVLVGLCTHLGCVPTDTFKVGVASGLGADWPGGWFCHCHGSKYDLSGRVFRNVPAPLNLLVPPYYFVTDTIVEIGVNPPTTRHS